MRLIGIVHAALSLVNLRKADAIDEVHGILVSDHAVENPRAMRQVPAIAVEGQFPDEMRQHISAACRRSRIRSPAAQDALAISQFFPAVGPLSIEIPLPTTQTSFAGGVCLPKPLPLLAPQSDCSGKQTIFLAYKNYFISKHNTSLDKKIAAAPKILSMNKHVRERRFARE